MEEAADELSKTDSVSFAELFTDPFMRKYTEFNFFLELLLAGGFQVNNADDFKKIPDAVFDAHISNHTQFEDWQEMMGKAAEEYAFRKLGF